MGKTRVMIVDDQRLARQYFELVVASAVVATVLSILVPLPSDIPNRNPKASARNSAEAHARPRISKPGRPFILEPGSGMPSDVGADA